MPNVLIRLSDMQLQASQWRKDGKRIGFVPTMGNLHRGHLSLLDAAAAQSEQVVVSIFVNPLQFNDDADFSAYPRTLQADLEQLAQFPNVTVFAPQEEEFYPRGRKVHCYVELPVMTDELEGAQRPGHFRGVTTVVAKLFNIVQPQLAVFGEKDYQQLLVLQRMVEDLCLPLEIIAMPTCRESDGLAMSSRNARLSQQQRRLAPALYQTLQRLRETLPQSGNDYAQLEAQAMQQLLKAGLQPEYVTIRDAENLALPGKHHSLVVLAAASLGPIRLIDNLRI